MDNLPDPDILAHEIVENIKAQSIYMDIEKRKSMMKELNSIKGVNITEEKLA